MKIDTEGHDLAVIKGGQRSIQAGIVQAFSFELGRPDVAFRTFLGLLGLHHRSRTEQISDGGFTGLDMKAALSTFRDIPTIWNALAASQIT